MNNKARVIHQLLMKCMMPKTSSRDLVTDIQQFCLCNVLSEIKVNLPSLIFNHMVTQEACKAIYTNVPYGVLLMRIMLSQGAVEVVKNQSEEFKGRYLNEIIKPHTYGESNLGKLQIPYNKLKPTKIDQVKLDMAEEQGVVVAIKARPKRKRSRKKKEEGRRKEEKSHGRGC